MAAKSRKKKRSELMEEVIDAYERVITLHFKLMPLRERINEADRDLAVVSAQYEQMKALMVAMLTHANASDVKEKIEAVAAKHAEAVEALGAAKNDLAILNTDLLAAEKVLASAKVKLKEFDDG